MLAKEQVRSGLLAVSLAKKHNLRVAKFPVKFAIPAVLDNLSERFLRGVNSILSLLGGLAPDCGE